MKMKQKKSRRSTRKPNYISMTRINVPELDTVIRRGEPFPNDLLLANYSDMLRQKLIVTVDEWDKLDKSLCFSCRIN